MADSKRSVINMSDKIVKNCDNLHYFFKCCKKKTNITYFVCKRCLEVFHKSCLGRSQLVYSSSHHIICRQCESVVIVEKRENDEMMSALKELVKELWTENEMRENHIKRLKHQEELFYYESTKMESDLNGMLTQKEKVIDELKKQIYDLTNKNHNEKKGQTSLENTFNSKLTQTEKNTSLNNNNVEKKNYTLITMNETYKRYNKKNILSLNKNIKTVSGKTDSRPKYTNKRVKNGLEGKDANKTNPRRKEKLHRGGKCFHIDEIKELSLWNQGKNEERNEKNLMCEIEEAEQRENLVLTSHQKEITESHVTSDDAQKLILSINIPLEKEQKKKKERNKKSLIYEIEETEQGENVILSNHEKETSESHVTVDYSRKFILPTNFPLEKDQEKKKERNEKSFMCEIEEAEQRENLILISHQKEISEIRMTSDDAEELTLSINVPLKKDQEKKQRRNGKSLMCEIEEAEQRENLILRSYQKEISESLVTLDDSDKLILSINVPLEKEQRKRKERNVNSLMCEKEEAEQGENVISTNHQKETSESHVTVDDSGKLILPTNFLLEKDQEKKKERNEKSLMCEIEEAEQRENLILTFHQKEISEIRMTSDDAEELILSINVPLGTEQKKKKERNEKSLMYEIEEAEQGENVISTNHEKETSESRVAYLGKPILPTNFPLEKDQEKKKRRNGKSLMCEIEEAEQKENLFVTYHQKVTSENRVIEDESNNFTLPSGNFLQNGVLTKQEVPIIESLENTEHEVIGIPVISTAASTRLNNGMSVKN